MKILIFQLMMLHFITIYSEHPPCLSKSNKAGTCVLIQFCPSLQKEAHKLSIIEFITRYSCGSDAQGNARVCCVDTEEDTSKTTLLENNVTLRNSIKNLNCGSRIVGNGPEWPFLMTLGRLKNGVLEPSCTGALISKDWIVMSAKCIIDTPLLTHAMAFHDFSQKEFSNMYNIITKRRGNYNSNTLLANIGMIKIHPQVSFRETVQPLCLPKPNNQQPNFYFALGGNYLENSTELLYVKGSPIYSGCRYPDNFVCILYHPECEYGKMDTILIHENLDNGRFELAGVGPAPAPYGSYEGFCRYVKPKFQIYNRVQNYTEWIANNLKETSPTLDLHARKNN